MRQINNVPMIKEQGEEQPGVLPERSSPCVIVGEINFYGSLRS